MNPQDTFWRMTIEEVQGLARERLGRDLTRAELPQVEKMFSEGIGWYDTLCITVDEIGQPWNVNQEITT